MIVWLLSVVNVCVVIWCRVLIIVWWCWLWLVVGWVFRWCGLMCS